MEKKNGAAQSLAMLVCAIMIFSAVCIGGYRYVASERANVLEYYVSGDGTQQDLGIRYLLEKRIGEANNLLTVASRYIATSDSAYADVANAVAALENEDNPNKAYTYNNTLTSSCDTLTAKLSGYALSEKDAQYLSEIKTNMTSYNMQAEHCVYNEKAAVFNEQVLGRFPTGTIAQLLGIKSLSLFGEDTLL
jgi:hypothetical protein